MKISKTLLVLLLSGALLTTSFCDSDDPDEDGTTALVCDTDGDVTELSGTYTSNVQVPAGGECQLSGAVIFTNGATFIVSDGSAGATVYAQAGSAGNPSFLVIDRGAKIDAQGTASDPVVFTTIKDAGTRAAGDWGGIVINGNSQYNAAGGTGEGEGDSGTFGGGANPDTADDSGTLSYVRVEFAGQLFSTENELNGIAFQAVGSGTTVEYLQVHRGKDDGVEFFGGTVNVSNIVVSYAQDDQFDWTSGWTGTAENVILLLDGGQSEDPRGIEGDNDEDNNDLTPRSNPTLRNFTMIGNNTKPDKIMEIRRGSYATMENFYIAHFCKAIINTDDAATTDAVGTDVIMSNSLIEEVAINDDDADLRSTCNAADFTNSYTTIASGGLYDPDDASGGTNTDDFIDNITVNATMSLLTYDGGTSLVDSFQPSSNVTLGGSYVGAVDASGSDWTSGWTSFPVN